MAVKTDEWLGAAGTGLVNAVLNDNQEEAQAEGFLESFGIPSNAIALNLGIIALAAFAPQLVPPNYRGGFEGAQDYAVGTTVQYLAARSGLGSMNYRGATQAQATAPPAASTGRRVLIGRPRAAARTAAPVYRPQPGLQPAGGFVSSDV